MVRRITGVYRTLDNQYGGGHVRDSLVRFLDAEVATLLRGRYDSRLGKALLSAAAEATQNDADVAFAQMMIPHHRQAVDMATLAETRASDPQVKQLAIKAAQDPEIATMTGWLTTWGKPTTAPSSMPGMDMGHGLMPGMMSDADMAQLQAAAGKDFDRQFCTMMIAHHQGAIQMARQEQTAGVNPDAKALAERIATSQQGEIDTMNKILARL
jgi:uncharacterized protein (DUF305 family)